jgi:hypothetical protein
VTWIGETRAAIRLPSLGQTSTTVRRLMQHIDAAAGGLVDWSEFDAAAERWGIEVRGLYPRDPYIKGDLPGPLPRLNGRAGTSICEDGNPGEVGFVGRSEGRKCSCRVAAG